VRAVAVGANRGLLRSVFSGTPMYAVLVRNEGLGADSIRLHQKLLPVTAAAGRGNVSVIHRRLYIVGGQNLVRASMAVLAISGWATGLGRFGVLAVLVCGLFVRMAIGAGGRKPPVLVLGIVGRFVTIHAGKHLAMNRMFQLAFVHIQTDASTVNLFGDGGVGVAGQAVLVVGLILRASRASQCEQ